MFSINPVNVVRTLLFNKILLLPCFNQQVSCIVTFLGDLGDVIQSQPQKPIIWLICWLSRSLMKKATDTVYSGSEQVMTSFPPPASPGNRIAAFPFPLWLRSCEFWFKKRNECVCVCVVPSINIFRFVLIIMSIYVPFPKLHNRLCDSNHSWGGICFFGQSKLQHSSWCWDGKVKRAS